MRPRQFTLEYVVGLCWFKVMFCVMCLMPTTGIVRPGLGEIVTLVRYFLGKQLFQFLHVNYIPFSFVFKTCLESILGL